MASQKVTEQHFHCLETLGNELRLQILGKLENGPSNVNQLAAALDAERSRVSHALQLLKQCHLVAARKEGRTMLYRLNEESPFFTEQKETLFRLVELHATKACAYCQKCGGAPTFH